MKYCVLTIMFHALLEIEHCADATSSGSWMMSDNSIAALCTELHVLHLRSLFVFCNSLRFQMFSPLF